MPKTSQLTTLQKKFQSNIKVLDVFYVIHDLKPVSRITIHDYELDRVRRFLKEFNLHSELSDFKILMEFTDGTYSNKGRKVDASSIIPGNHFVYISKDPEKAKAAKHAESENDHATLGALLGYPPCCTDFYIRFFSTEASKKLDFAVPIIQNSESFIADFRMNTFSRYIDYAVLSHFPHSFQCQASLNLASSFYAEIERDNPAFAKELAKNMRDVVIYSSKGIYLLFNTKRKEMSFTYKDIKATNITTDLYAHLQKEKKLKIIDKTSFLLGNTLYKNTNVMVFE